MLQHAIYMPEMYIYICAIYMHRPEKSLLPDNLWLVLSESPFLVGFCSTEHAEHA